MQAALRFLTSSDMTQKETVKRDYGAVRKAISDLLEADEYDDGARNARFWSQAV